MKKIIFGLMLFAMLWSIYWTLGYLDMSDFSQLEKQTYSLMSNLKYITVILFYIAWRVTPESKQ